MENEELKNIKEMLNNNNNNSMDWIYIILLLMIFGKKEQPIINIYNKKEGEE